MFSSRFSFRRWLGLRCGYFLGLMVQLLGLSPVIMFGPYVLCQVACITMWVIRTLRARQ